jgi:hypothetical protein
MSLTNAHVQVFMLSLWIPWSRRTSRNPRFSRSLFLEGARARSNLHSWTGDEQYSTVSFVDLLTSSCRNTTEIFTSNNPFCSKDESCSLSSHRRNRIRYHQQQQQHDTCQGMCSQMRPFHLFPWKRIFDSAFCHCDDGLVSTDCHHFARGERRWIEIFRLVPKHRSYFPCLAHDDKHRLPQILYRIVQRAPLRVASSIFATDVARKRPVIVAYGTGRRN